MRYEIVDLQTKAVVTTVNSLRAAIRAVDRRDQEYGAHRYTHRRKEN